ncbi:BgTH12-04289 [Blumeria graminis f. sp. triticale]|uniref:BgTH12-04289 n=1 Tax=Blumeria graminis f. sp. triticale TaxID=1689686 RepID=A0A9W4DIF3_BLUGR|nr:BgTH12-04289 [Blumeria graminis f. sp. triticale]
MANRTLPKFEQAGRFVGEGNSGARWLSRLEYDFRTAGHTTVSPENFFFAIDILFEDEAAGWLDSTPELRAFIDDRQNSTDEQVAEFKQQLIEMFPAKLVNHVEGNLQNDIQDFMQKEAEPLTAYYQRALHILRRSHGRDAPRTAALGRPMIPIEQTVLNSIILAFLNGLREEDVRCEALSRSALSCGSMWRCQEIILGVKQSLDAAKEARERAAERNEMAQIRDLCSSHYGKSVSSVLADLSSGRIMVPKPRQGFSNEASYYQPRPPHHQQQQFGNGFNHANKDSPPAHQTLGGNTTNRQSTYNPGNVSKNAFVNGAAIYKASDGPLCFGCGHVGHIKPKCQNLQLQNWEQIHLKNLIYDRPQPPRESNSVHYGHRYGRWKESQDFHRPLNPHSDLHNLSENYSSRSRGMNGNYMDVPDQPQLNSAFGYRPENYGSSQHSLNHPPARTESQETHRDEPEGSWRAPPKVHFADQRDADCSLSQFADIDIPDDHWQHTESKACELGTQVQSFSSGPGRKRQRIDIEDILSNNSPNEPVNEDENPGICRPIKPARKGKRILKHLREIVGREGCGPMDYVELARRICIPLNLLELWQVSPDTAKEFRRLSTRMNKKKGKQVPAQFFSSAADNGLARSVQKSQETKAFRIPVVARAEANGKIIKVALPKHISQADQGSEMNIISQGLVKALRLEKISLGTKGFSGLTMNTADGSATELSHFVSFDIGVCRIWRRIDAFVRPVVKKNGELDLHLLLGIPWLHDVNAGIFIRDSKIILGDPKLNEAKAAIVGPTFMSSSGHKLVLYPRQALDDEGHREEPSEPRAKDIVESDTDTTDESDDTDSDFDDELPKVVTEEITKEDSENPFCQQPQDSDLQSCVQFSNFHFNKDGHPNDPNSSPILSSNSVLLESMSCTFDETAFEPSDQKAPRILKKNRDLLTKQLMSVMGVSDRKHCLTDGTVNGFNSQNDSNSNEPSTRLIRESFDLAGTFPTSRRPRSRPLSKAPKEEIDEWFGKVGVKIGTAVGDDFQRDMVKRLLFTYRDINGVELEQLVPTDLYVHRVRIREGTKPFSKVKQKRWPPGKEFWLQKIVNEGLSCGMFEKTMAANGKLSDWNAQAVIVDKSDNPGPWDEPRITFNYQNVKEDMPGCYLELMAKVHDHLSHPSHKFFLKFDVKHGYWNILVHPEDRHFFAFTIAGIGQVQPTRMPQGSMSAGFSSTELMYIVLGDIPPGQNQFPGMKSVLVPEDNSSPPKASFYIDDMFSGFQNFKDAYDFMADELFPRLEWSRLKLSFKKMELFKEEVVALGTLHKKGGIVCVTPERRDKIRIWPTPTNASEVRAFLGAINMTRRWVKNFAEIKVPLSRLTGNGDWRWGEAEQVSFQLLQEKCSGAIEMHGWNFKESTVMYSDASNFGAGCAVTQSRIIGGKRAEVPILYDAFTFTKCQRNYGTYKRELCAIVEFCRKYDYMFRSPIQGTIFTDHHPLTYFLKSSCLDGIYARWASELRFLNIEIAWIPGSRNPIADALSRTIFPGEIGKTKELTEFGDLVNENGDPKWIWKDGTNGYETLLKSIGEPLKEEDLRALFLGDMARKDLDSKMASISLLIKELGETVPTHVAFELLNSLSEISTGVYKSSWVSAGAEAMGGSNCLISNVSDSQVPSTVPQYNSAPWVKNVIRTKTIAPHTRFSDSIWYKEISIYLKTGIAPKKIQTKVHQAAFLKKASKYQVQGPERVLYLDVQGVLKRCITEKEVSSLLLQAHDNGGHFASSITMRKLSKYYWPAMVKDVRDYIAGCLVCAKHGTAVRSQKMARVSISTPMELLGIDFIGPFPKFEGVEVYYILVVVDYFSRFVWSQATKSDNSESVISTLERIFLENGVPTGIYSDPGAHFGKDTQRFAESRGVMWCTSPVAAKKATGMVEKAVDILQRALKKNARDPSRWPTILSKSTFDVNRRDILHLGFSPHEILKGFAPDGNLEAVFPSNHRESLKSLLSTGTPDVFPEDDDVHGDLVIDFILNREETRRTALIRSDSQKDRAKDRHNLGVRAGHVYVPGSLVMLWDAKAAGKKLRPAWRGPFVVVGYGGDMERSFILRQVDGSRIPRHYYGDHLKPFRLREGYLITQEEEEIPVYQNLRLGNAAFKLPKYVEKVRGVHDA